MKITKIRALGMPLAVMLGGTITIGAEAQAQTKDEAKQSGEVLGRYIAPHTTDLARGGISKLIYRAAATRDPEQDIMEPDGYDFSYLTDADTRVHLAAYPLYRTK
ncbi:MAG: hypothetical protein LBF56_01520 [Holosporales bacterium]|nr:hypothetical protein [Holosporales bacterium]